MEPSATILIAHRTSHYNSCIGTVAKT